MKLRGVDTYKISVLASIALLYLMITDGPEWAIYLALGIVLLERAVVAFLMYILAKIQKEMAKQLMETLAEARNMAQPLGPFDQEME